MSLARGRPRWGRFRASSMAPLCGNQLCVSARRPRTLSTLRCQRAWTAAARPSSTSTESRLTGPPPLSPPAPLEALTAPHPPTLPHNGDVTDAPGFWDGARVAERIHLEPFPGAWDFIRYMRYHLGLTPMLVVGLTIMDTESLWWLRDGLLNDRLSLLHLLFRVTDPHSIELARVMVADLEISDVIDSLLANSR